MSEREKIVEAMLAENWSNASTELFLADLDRAGYEVRPKAEPMSMPQIAIPNAADIPTRAEVEALCEKAKRDGAAMALRAWARAWAGSHNERPRAYMDMSDRIERGEDVT